MILVLGATGTTGGEVARQLIAAGEKPRLLVRNRARASEFEGKAEIVEGELDNPASLTTALQGVEKVFLVSAGLDGPHLEIKFIDAAKRAGVRHIVKLSVIGADEPALTFSKWHARVEKHLKDSGLSWTMLRPGNFMSNALLLWGATIRTQGEFYQPTGEGRWAAIDPADIGAVAVQALTKPGHEGKAYTLTGPESLTAAQYAETLSSVLGKPVRFVDVSPEGAKQSMLASGIPAEYVEAIMNLMAAMKAGQTDIVTDTFERVMGRKPTRFEDWVRRNRAAL